MTSQQTIEQNVRMVIGDLHVQLIMAQARIAELEQQLADVQARKPQFFTNSPNVDTNGADMTADLFDKEPMAH